MSRKGSEKCIKLNVLHKGGEWRTKSRFENIKYAEEDETRGVKALFSNGNDYLQSKGYSDPLFAIVWDIRRDSNAHVYYKRFVNDTIEKRTISKIKAEEFEKNGPDVKLLCDLFDLEVSNFDLRTKTAGSEANALFQDICELIELGDSEREQMIKARIGQGKFRQNVIRVWGSETCALTLTPVKDMLIASHIKAWRNCESTTERLDGANGILLCAHIDKLFDKHRITFRKVGREFRLKLADDLDRSLMAQLGVNEGDALAIDRMHKANFEKFEDFLSHHEKIFCQLNDITML